MIRTITFGALCLAGLGAIAAAKVAPVKVSQTSSDDTTQMIAGNKSDRLSVRISPRNDPLTAIDKIDALYDSPTDARPETLNNSKPEATPLPPKKIISRHWHDPYDTKVKHLPAVSSNTKQSKRGGEASNQAKK